MTINNRLLLLELFLLMPLPLLTLKFFHWICLIDLVICYFDRSDVLGQFMPMVGVDWSQTGVAHLFSAIKVCCMPSYIFKMFWL